MNSLTLIAVRFYEHHDKHNEGETGGFPYAEARALVDAGVAVYVKPPPGVDEQGVPLPNPEGEAGAGD
jgi:hypothetical protein